MATRPQARFTEADFERLTPILRRIFAVDPTNGHALYFRAEKSEPLTLRLRLKLTAIG